MPPETPPQGGPDTFRRERSSVAATQAVVRYYDQTWLDYRVVWLNRANLAFHFGYHDAQHRGHSAALENSNRVLADIAEVRAEDRVLDAGCALGGSACWLASHREATVVGVTPVASQVERARRIAEARGLGGRVRFEQADYTNTPFPDASFDVVWALESLCHAPEKAAFYREAARLLKSGGRLVVAEYMRTTRRLDAANARLVRIWLDGWAIPDLDTGDEHMAAARAGGFADVVLLDGTGYTRRSLLRLYRRAVAAYPIAVALRLFGLRNGTQHGNVVASIRQYQALRRGCWLYGILYGRKP